MKHAKQSKIHQVKITLKYIRPPIWRRIEVPGDVTLDELHLILQAAMGWAEKKGDILVFVIHRRVMQFICSMQLHTWSGS